jgi:hypothetical protein
MGQIWSQVRTCKRVKRSKSKVKTSAEIVKPSQSFLYRLPSAIFGIVTTFLTVQTDVHANPLNVSHHWNKLVRENGQFHLWIDYNHSSAGANEHVLKWFQHQHHTLQHFDSIYGNGIFTHVRVNLRTISQMPWLEYVFTNHLPQPLYVGSPRRYRFPTLHIVFPKVTTLFIDKLADERFMLFGHEVDEPLAPKHFTSIIQTCFPALLQIYTPSVHMSDIRNIAKIQVLLTSNPTTNLRFVNREFFEKSETISTLLEEKKPLLVKIYEKMKRSDFEELESKVDNTTDTYSSVTDLVIGDMILYNDNNNNNNNTNDINDVNDINDHKLKPISIPYERFATILNARFPALRRVIIPVSNFVISLENNARNILTILARYKKNLECNKSEQNQLQIIINNNNSDIPSIQIGLITCSKCLQDDVLSSPFCSLLAYCEIKLQNKYVCLICFPMTSLSTGICHERCYRNVRNMIQPPSSSLRYFLLNS